MFDAVRNNKRIVQVFLVLITLPFAFFGLESYVGSASDADHVAKIGDSKITQQQFQQAVREQQERLTASMGQVDPALLNSPEARKAIINDLVNQRVLLLEASKQHLMVSDQALAQMIASIDAFKVDNRFSQERYRAVVASQGMSVEGFEAQLRRDMVLQQLAGSIGQSGLVSRSVVDRLLALQMEKRDVVELRLNPENYLDKVKLAEGAVAKFYEENSKRFELPEQAKAEYVVLSMDALSSQLAVTEAEVKAWYDGHQERFKQSEERRASHILITTDKSDKAKAKARAEELLAEIKKTPSAFADLAKKNSQDPGSAAKGGDLGFFGRGMMVKPFEEAAFQLKEGEVSGLVESDFGFHIIKVTGIRAAKVKAFSDVKAEIEGELRKTAAARKFAEAAEAFSNMVYEQSDSLKPVADKFKLSIKQTDWIGRKPVAANGPLANEKVLASLFSDEVVKNKRNTEAVEIAANTLVAARILDYKPVTRQPLDTVKTNIESLLKRQEAHLLAKKDGEARLESLKKGEDKQAWGAAKTVSRLDPRQLPQAAIAPVFKLESGKLPAYTGVELPDAGYVLYKLNKVDAGEKLDEVRRQGLAGQLTNLANQEEVQNYLAALRSRYKVEINQSAINAREK